MNNICHVWYFIEFPSSRQEALARQSNLPKEHADDADKAQMNAALIGKKKQKKGYSVSYLRISFKNLRHLRAFLMRKVDVTHKLD